MYEHAGTYRSFSRQRSLGKHTVQVHLKAVHDRHHTTTHNTYDRIGRG